MSARGSGILMHITSLPGPGGIGTFGKAAYEFVDFLEESGQKYWQVLPLGSTGEGDSPYQSFSAFAGNPYFIDLDILSKLGLLRKDDYEGLDFGNDDTRIDYKKIFDNKMPVLRIAFKNSYGKYNEEIKKFRYENRKWIEDYSLYMAVKSVFGLKSWQKWDDDIKSRNSKAVDYYRKSLRDELNYWVFLQYLFFTQWMNLKNYANSKEIKIIGDIPIYTAEDSVDTWANSDMFLLDECKNPVVVSGCPPDAFSDTGQLWGNPIYDWNYLEKTDYKWWIDRIKINTILYDIIRIDHFRGFKSFWQVPYGEQTAVNGKWKNGPGIKLFDAVKMALGHINIIAEDLGYMTKEVVDFRNTLGFPGMRVLEFAFKAGEQSSHLPHNYDKNCVAYTGTHDNDTVIGWIRNSKMEDVNFASEYLKLDGKEGYNWGFIRGILSSVANLTICQFQDYLGLDSDARMNIPSTTSGNWRWRVKKEDLTYELAQKINKITKLYGR